MDVDVLGLNEADELIVVGRVTTHADSGGWWADAPITVFAERSGTLCRFRLYVAALNLDVPVQCSGGARYNVKRGDTITLDWPGPVIATTVDRA